MRITVHLPDGAARELQRLAGTRKQSVSSLTAEAVEHYVGVVRKRESGRKLADLAGKVTVRPDAHALLDRGRMDDDRRA